MAVQLPKFARTLLVLALIAFGLALGVNAFVARAIAVDPERLAAAKARAPGQGEGVAEVDPRELSPEEQGKALREKGTKGAGRTAKDSSGEDGVAAAETKAEDDKLPSEGRDSETKGSDGQSIGTPLADTKGAGNTDVATEPSPAGPRELNPLDRARMGVDHWKTPILKRNLFDSAQVGVPPTESEGGEAVVDGDCTRKSDVGATIVAVSVASDPTWSTALISVPSATPALAVYRPGDAIEGVTIKEILRHVPEFDERGRLVGSRAARVHVLRGAVCEYLELGSSTTRAPAGKSSEEPTKDGAAAAGGKSKWEGIKETGPGEYSIEKGTLDQALGNLDKLGREARVVPNFQDGATNGFKIFSIRRDSVAKKLGLQNNDILKSINGNDLDPAAAMTLFGKLSSERSFSLEILRDGKPMTMRYNIQ